MISLRTTYGDAAQPEGEGPRLIAHVVNDFGAWGAGFTKSLDEHWPESGRDYREWHKSSHLNPEYTSFKLGAVRYTIVQGGPGSGGDNKGPVWIAHMLAQHGLRNTPTGYNRPLRYDALGACLLELGRMAKFTKASVHMPVIGCGLGGGDWGIVLHLVEDALCRNDIPTTIYMLEKKT